MEGGSMKHTRILSAAAALLFVATAAQAQRGRDDHRDRQDQRGQGAQANPQHHGDDDRRAAVQSQQSQQSQQRGVEQARAEQARAAEIQSQQRAARDDEQRRELQSRQRDHDDQLDRARRVNQEEQLERARQVQQQEQLEQARRRAEVNRVYDRDRDDRPGYDYRYNMGGVYRQTNQYGVDALRRAVDLGYQQGYRAGQVDRRNGAAADYRRALDFQNDDFGYAGSYVPQSDYNYYFREGFQRGYDDAYWSRSRYGTYYNGNASILADVVAGILGLR